MTDTPASADSQSATTGEIIDAKLALVSALMRLDDLGVDVARLDLGATTGEIIDAKLALVSALMHLDNLGVDVAGIDLNAVLEFGRKLNSI